MLLENNEMYIVSEHAKYKGLTVTDYVFKAGQKFSRAQWKWGSEALEAAVENGRCKLVVEKKEEKSEKDNANELEKLLKAYSKIENKETKKAKELQEKIAALKGDIDESD